MFEELYYSKRTALHEEIRAQEEARLQRILEQQSYTGGFRHPIQKASVPLNSVEVIEIVDIQNVNPSFLLGKLDSLRISEHEANQLYHFLKSNKHNLSTFNLNFADIRRRINRALGKITDPKLRTPLVEIEYL